MNDNTTTITALQIERPMYGVWIPGEGWLHPSVTREPYAETMLEKAQSTARRVGKHARVEFIDKSLVDMQDLFLAAERETWQARLAQFVKQIKKA